MNTYISSRKDDYAKHPTDNALELVQFYLSTPEGDRILQSRGYKIDAILENLKNTPKDKLEPYIEEVPLEHLQHFMDWYTKIKQCQNFLSENSV